MRLTSLLSAGFLALATPVLAASPMGDDGLHKPDWLHDTFKDMGEDLATATSEGKRMLVIWEQRGCIYCKKMHEEVFPDPEITEILTDKYYVVRRRGSHRFRRHRPEREGYGPPLGGDVHADDDVHARRGARRRDRGRGLGGDDARGLRQGYDKGASELGA